MQITININAPELVGAINNLATAFQGKGLPIEQPQHQEQKQPEPVQQYNAPQQQIYVPPAQPSKQYNAPQQQPTGGAVPTNSNVPAGGVPAGGVPTAQKPAYTIEQLGVAATPLVDNGKGEELRAWLQQHGASALKELDKSHYDAFAAHLRSMGAKI